MIRIRRNRDLLEKLPAIRGIADCFHKYLYSRLAFAVRFSLTRHVCVRHVPQAGQSIE
jgi:hypothetical protein